MPEQTIIRPMPVSLGAAYNGTTSRKMTAAMKIIGMTMGNCKDTPSTVAGMGSKDSLVLILPHVTLSTFTSTVCKLTIPVLWQQHCCTSHHEATATFFSKHRISFSRKSTLNTRPSKFPYAVRIILPLMCKCAVMQCVALCHLCASTLSNSHQKTAFLYNISITVHKYVRIRNVTMR